jgi:hypothetical protein
MLILVLFANIIRTEGNHQLVSHDQVTFRGKILQRSRLDHTVISGGLKGANRPLRSRGPAQ